MAECLRLQAQEIWSPRECVLLRATRSDSKTAPHRKPVQQFDTYGERQLLASYGIHQGFKGGRESRRFEAAKLAYQWREACVLCRKSVKTPEIGPESQDASQQFGGSMMRLQGDMRGNADRDVKSRTVDGAGLGGRYLHRCAVNHQHPPVGTTIPTIHDVAGAPAERPGG